MKKLIYYFNIYIPFTSFRQWKLDVMILLTKSSGKYPYYILFGITIQILREFEQHLL